MKLMKSFSSAIHQKEINSLQNHQSTTCLEVGTKRAPLLQPIPRKTHPLELGNTEISGKCAMHHLVSFTTLMFSWTTQAVEEKFISYKGSPKLFHLYNITKIS